MGVQMKIGDQVFESVEVKARGKTTLLEQVQDCPDSTEVEASPAGLIQVGIEGGQTVQLAKFSFGKFDIQFSMSVLPEHADEATELCERIVDELSAREVACLTDIKRENKPLRIELAEGDLHCPTIRLQYGCTIPTGQYESRRVSVTRTKVFGAGDDIEAGLVRLQQWAQNRIIARGEQATGANTPD